jgi:hypothetical protein
VGELNKRDVMSTFSNLHFSIIHDLQTLTAKKIEENKGKMEQNKVFIEVDCFRIDPFSMCDVGFYCSTTPKLVLHNIYTFNVCLVCVITANIDTLI